MSKPDQSDSRNLGGTIARYASSVMVRQILGIINAYLKPLLLTPQMYGLWNLLQSVLTYMPVTHLGARSAMRYRIPANEAKGEEETNASLAGTVLKGSMCLTGMGCAGLVAAALLVPMQPEAAIGMLVMAAVAAIFFFASFQVALFKSRGRFQPITTSNYLKATGGCILKVALILAFGFYGLLAALVLTHLLVFAYLRSRSDPQPLGAFRPRLFLELVREGFPIIALSLGVMLIRTMDRFIISAFLGLEELGHYGIAIMGLNFLMHVPDASRDVIEPRLIRDLETRPAKDCLRDYVTRPLLLTAYGMPILLGAAMLLLPLAVELLLPRYRPGILPAQIITASSLFLALSFVLRGIIIARGRQLQAMGITLLAVAINIILSIAFVQQGWGIAGVSLGSASSFALLFFGLWVFVRRREPDLSDVKILPLLLPLILACGLAVLAAHLGERPEVPASAAGPAGTMFLVILLLPLYNRVGRRTELWKPVTIATWKEWRRP